MINTDDADDQVLLANTEAQVESLLQSLQQTPEGIGLCVNSNKLKLAIPTLSGL